MKIRSYTPKDYKQLIALYQKSGLYGGQFDADRDSFDRLKKRIEADPDAILVAEESGRIIGTVSLIEDSRVAWLFRFAVLKGDREETVAASLYNEVTKILRARGHKQVLVYSPAGDPNLDHRYGHLGFTRGGDYTCFWRDI